jgi:hypothetical protein
MLEHMDLAGYTIPELLRLDKMLSFAIMNFGAKGDD